MDKINKREFLKATSLLGAAAVPAIAAADTPTAATNAPATDLLDDRFSSRSGRRFGSQVIHHGEQVDSGSLKGFGGMLGVQWKKDAVHRNLGKHVSLILNATSLGDPVTRIVLRKEEKLRGIPPRFARVSIGLEEPEDLVADFKQAIEKCG